MRNRVFVFLLVFILFLSTGCRRADQDVVILPQGDSFFDESLQIKDDGVTEYQEVNPVQDASTFQVDDSGDCSTQTAAVYVCGAVRNPGVYYLEAGSRLMDAVDAAGGFLEDADDTYVNLAAVVVDGTKLKIPTVHDNSNENGSEVIESFDLEVYSSTQSEDLGGKCININTASKEELKTLPGIGDGIADRIIKYRTDNGKFKSTEDIMKISGIKDKLFSKIKGYICV